uniref:GLTP domain-containing protein n=1 Tax=Mesocestoides corti TaxID=53468 RepID=A0A5K3ESF9_MESCO
MSGESSTFFDKFSKNPSCETVLNIEELLRFSGVIIEFCELQSVALAPVKKDVGGNIKKIDKARHKYNVTTVEEMLIKEIEVKVNKNSDSGTMALLWLKRAIELIIEVLAGLAESPNLEMKDIVYPAYERTLMKHHNIIMKSAFSVGLRLFPDKKTFLLRLAYNQPNMETQVLKSMKEFVDEYRTITDPLHQLLVKYGAEGTPTPEADAAAVSQQ